MICACGAESDLERLEKSLDGLAGSAKSLGAQRLGPVLNAIAMICKERDIARIQQSVGQFMGEVRILQGALEMMKQEQEQARFLSSSRARIYYLPMARGISGSRMHTNWKRLHNRPAEATHKNQIAWLLNQTLRSCVSEATSIIGLACFFMTRTKISTMRASNWALAQRASSARASVDERPFL